MYESAGHYMSEKKGGVVTIAGVSVSTGALVGVTEKGPIGEATLVTSWDKFVEKFGGFITNGWTAYAAYAIYKNKPGAKLYITRTAHYTDITDASSLTAFKSTVTINDVNDASPLPTLKVSAINEGTWGDKLKARITVGATAGTFKLEVLETVAGTDRVLEGETYENLTMDDTADNFVEFAINGKSKYITVEDLDSTNSDPTPLAGTYALTGGNDGLAGITDLDFVGDSAARTGLYAFNTINALLAVAIPGKTTSTIHDGLKGYCEGRKDRYFVADAPFGLDAQGIKDYVENTWGVNSDYGEINWPNLKITDPLTARPKVVPNSGFVLGAMLRTFDDPAKGPWKTAAGVEDGQLNGVIGLETDEVNDKGARDVIYPAHINPIYFKSGYGIIKYGGRTLSKTGFKYANQRWTFLYCEKSIEEGTQYEEFENIDLNLMKKSERTIKAFLLGVWRDGGLKGAKPAESFFVKIDAENNPESSIQEGKLRHRIGLAVHTPNEFSIFTFERDTRALDAELAAAEV